MYAFSEDQTIAFIVLIGTLFTAVSSLIGVIYQARKTRGQLNTGNGHTIGQATSRLEDLAWRH